MNNVPGSVPLGGLLGPRGPGDNGGASALSEQKMIQYVSLERGVLALQATDKLTWATRRCNQPWSHVPQKRCCQERWVSAWVPCSVSSCLRYATSFQLPSTNSTLQSTRTSLINHVDALRYAHVLTRRTSRHLPPHAPTTLHRSQRHGPRLHLLGQKLRQSRRHLLGIRMLHRGSAREE